MDASLLCKTEFDIKYPVHIGNISEHFNSFLIKKVYI